MSGKGGKGKSTKKSGGGKATASTKPTTKQATTKAAIPSTSSTQRAAPAASSSDNKQQIIDGIIIPSFDVAAAHRRLIAATAAIKETKDAESKADRGPLTSRAMEILYNENDAIEMQDNADRTATQASYATHIRHFMFFISEGEETLVLPQHMTDHLISTFIACYWKAKPNRSSVKQAMAALHQEAVRLGIQWYIEQPSSWPLVVKTLKGIRASDTWKRNEVKKPGLIKPELDRAIMDVLSRDNVKDVTALACKVLLYDCAMRNDNVYNLKNDDVVDGIFNGERAFKVHVRHGKNDQAGSGRDADGADNVNFIPCTCDSDDQCLDQPWCSYSVIKLYKSMKIDCTKTKHFIIALNSRHTGFTDGNMGADTIGAKLTYCVEQVRKSNHPGRKAIPKEKITGRSGRASAVTNAVNEAAVPLTAVKQMTHHKSMEVLATYRQPDVATNMQASKSLGQLRKDAGGHETKRPRSPVSSDDGADEPPAKKKPKNTSKSKKSKAKKIAMAQLALAKAELAAAQAGSSSPSS